MERKSNALGQHILVEYYDCDKEIMNDLTAIKTHMVQAAKECGATVVQDVFHLFNPHGVSGVVVIAESHLAIHTWPEYGFAAVDLFTCGTEVDPWIAFDYLKDKFKAERHLTMEMKRGVLGDSVKDLAFKPNQKKNKEEKRVKLHAV